MSNDEPIFDSDVDPKRIKSVADGLRRQGEFESARMLDSYAAVLAAAPQQAAEPVYQYQDTPDSWVDCDYDLYNASGDPKRILYTRPQPAQDAKDGARYRFLADHQDADLYMENPGKELLDRAIDAAMAKESGR